MNANAPEGRANLKAHLNTVDRNALRRQWLNDVPANDAAHQLGFELGSVKSWYDWFEENVEKVLEEEELLSPTVVTPAPAPAGHYGGDGTLQASHSGEPSLAEVLGDGESTPDESADPLA